MTSLLPTLDGRKLPAFTVRQDKRPSTPHGLHDATADPLAFADLRRRYPGPLIGVPTGEASGFDALDIDPAGLDWLANNEHQLPATRRHETRRGTHLLFQHVPGLRGSAARIAAGVDVRADGNFCVWWPSAGYAASWPAQGPMIAPWPDWLLELAMTRDGRKSTLRESGHLPKAEHDLPPLPKTIEEEVTIFSRFKQTVPRWSREESWAYSALTRAMNAVMDAPEGRRNHILNGEGYALGRLMARGWVAGDMVVFALGHGAKCCGYIRDHGEPATVAAIRHAVVDGMRQPYPDLTPLARSEERLEGLCGVAEAERDTEDQAGARQQKEHEAAMLKTGRHHEAQDPQRPEDP